MICILLEVLVQSQKKKPIGMEQSNSQNKIWNTTNSKNKIWNTTNSKNKIWNTKEHNKAKEDVPFMFLGCTPGKSANKNVPKCLKFEAWERHTSKLQNSYRKAYYI